LGAAEAHGPAGAEQERPFIAVATLQWCWLLQIAETLSGIECSSPGDVRQLLQACCCWTRKNGDLITGGMITTFVS
jgi:hypothetical protein